MQKNKKFLLPIITAISILFSGYIPVMADVDLSTIPAYTGEPYVEINDNVPDFPEDDFTTDSFESYSDLDNLGRCGVAYANIGQDLMPTEKRGSIGQVKPSAVPLGPPVKVIRSGERGKLLNLSQISQQR